MYLAQIIFVNFPRNEKWPFFWNLYILTCFECKKCDFSSCTTEIYAFLFTEQENFPTSLSIAQKMTKIKFNSIKIFKWWVCAKTFSSDVGDN